MGLVITKRGYKAAKAADEIKEFKVMSELLAMKIIVDWEIGCGNMDQNLLEVNDSTAEEIIDCFDLEGIEFESTNEEIIVSLTTCVENEWLVDEDSIRD